MIELDKKAAQSFPFDATSSNITSRTITSIQRDAFKVGYLCKDRERSKPTPLQEATYAELVSRLRSWVDYTTHRDDDPEYGQPLDPLVSLRKYFEASGMPRAAELLDEVIEL